MREQRLERRVVTALFVDVVGSTTLTLELGPERVKRALDRAFGELAALIAAEGGTVEKYIGDAIHALFGVPATHPDDPQRALRAAHACVLWTAAARTSVPLAVRAGVETGEAIIDLAATETERQQMSIGPCVNVAARLQQVAEPGQVVVGPTCREATAEMAEFAGLGDVDLKGLGRLPAWRLLALVRPHARVACPSWAASPSSRSSGSPTRAPEPGVACWPWSPVRPARGRRAWSRSSSRVSARRRASSRRGVARRGDRGGSPLRQLLASEIRRRPSRDWRGPDGAPARRHRASPGRDRARPQRRAHGQPGAGGTAGGPAPGRARQRLAPLPRRPDPRRPGRRVDRGSPLGGRRGRPAARSPDARRGDAAAGRGDRPARAGGAGRGAAGRRPLLPHARRPGRRDGPGARPSRRQHRRGGHRARGGQPALRHRARPRALARHRARRAAHAERGDRRPPGGAAAARSRAAPVRRGRRRDVHGAGRGPPLGPRSGRGRRRARAARRAALPPARAGRLPLPSRARPRRRLRPPDDGGPDAAPRPLRAGRGAAGGRRGPCPPSLGSRGTGGRRVGVGGQPGPSRAPSGGAPGPRAGG